MKSARSAPGTLTESARETVVGDLVFAEDIVGARFRHRAARTAGRH